MSEALTAAIARVAYTGDGVAPAEPVVLLHGWGSDLNAWGPLLEPLSASHELLCVSLPGFANAPAVTDFADHIDAWVDALAAQLPPRFLLLGWSLGGMLATRLAARHPQSVNALVTLATNLKFATASDWSTGLNAETFAQFRAGFDRAPAVTLKRFAGLMAHGDGQEKALIKTLRQLASDSFSEARTQAWADGLSALAGIDNRAAFAELSMPGLHVLGQNDALVPAAVADTLGGQNRTQRCEVLAGTGHALATSQPQCVAEKVLAFWHRVQAQVDKRKVAESFSRAAPAYDSVAAIQRQIGETLLLNRAAKPAETLLDLGSGTGYFTPLLSEYCERQVSLDLAEGMLQFAAEQHPGLSAGVCGDAEQLPFASDSFDGLFSSLAIQWCADLPQLFKELKRIMKPGAQLNIATLGPRTLFELREAWQAVDNYTHVNEFAPRTHLEAAAAEQGLAVLGFDEQDIVLRYQQVRELTYELKTLGAHNMNQGQSSGLTGRQRIKQFREAYEGFRLDDGDLPATYEVFYLTLQA